MGMVGMVTPKVEDVCNTLDSESAFIYFILIFIVVDLRLFLIFRQRSTCVLFSMKIFNIKFVQVFILLFFFSFKKLS